jgi:hypothetical protein
MGWQAAKVGAACRARLDGLELHTALGFGWVVLALLIFGAIGACLR